jgi:predicted glycosyltransferase
MDQPLKEKTRISDGLAPGKPRILVAPLDWGLGHATRCIPIIRELLAQGCDVWLAGEGLQEHLLKQEFFQLPFLNLPGYRIHYAKTKKGLLWKMIQQGPKIRRAILYEHQWLKRVVKENRFDAVISDNRYGLYHSEIPCIIITHQLNIKSFAGSWSEKILQNRNYKYIGRFTECWVPDTEEGNNLAGQLSHPEKKPAVTLRYIGYLSRFQPPGKCRTENKNHLLIILSGPEPQRSILEDKIIKEISHYHGTAVIVRGLPGSASLIPSTNMIHFYNHLTTNELNEEMLKAEYIISRSGYSTVMDLVALQKKSIFIPTPGQTEQEYLSKYLFQKQIAFCISQKEFSLNDVLLKAGNFSYHIPEINTGNLLHKSVSDFIATIRIK